MEVILYAQCVSFWAISLIYNTWHCPHRLRRSCSTRQWQTLFQTEWRALIEYARVFLHSCSQIEECDGHCSCDVWRKISGTLFQLSIATADLSIAADPVHPLWPHLLIYFQQDKAQIISNCPEREVSSLTEGHCSDRSHRRVSCPDTWSHPQQWGSSDSHSGYERRHSAFESREYC